MLYILNLYSAIYQLYLNKTERKKIKPGWQHDYRDSDPDLLQWRSVKQLELHREGGPPSIEMSSLTLKELKGRLDANYRGTL